MITTLPYLCIDMCLFICILLLGLLERKVHVDCIHTYSLLYSSITLLYFLYHLIVFYVAQAIHTDDDNEMVIHAVLYH